MGTRSATSSWPELRELALATRGAYISVMSEQSKPPSPRSAGKIADKPQSKLEKTPEHGGPKGPEPTRYGDWEIGGRCIDF